MGIISHWTFSVSGGLVLARPDRDGLFLLNPTAELIWNQYIRGLTAADSVHEFQAIFGIPPAIAQRDIEATFAQWQAGLLSLATPPPPDPPRATPHPDALPIDCVLNGVRFRVLIAPGDLVDEIFPRLKHLAASFSVPDFTIAVNPTPDGLPATARMYLLDEMTRRCQPGRESRAILHAGACGTASACVLLAGATHSGKSTLCAALMHAGFICYSDDSSLLDLNFDVAGMPFPLMLREGSWSHFPHLQHSPTLTRFGVNIRFLPSNLPGTSPSVAPKALVFVQYQAGADPLIEQINTFDALVALEKTGFWVEHRYDNIAAFLTWLGNLPKYRLAYSEFSDAMKFFRSLI